MKESATHRPGHYGQFDADSPLDNLQISRGRPSPLAPFALLQFVLMRGAPPYLEWAVEPFPLRTPRGDQQQFAEVRERKVEKSENAQKK